VISKEVKKTSKHSNKGSIAGEDTGVSIRSNIGETLRVDAKTCLRSNNEVVLVEDGVPNAGSNRKTTSVSFNFVDIL
jgi:hypothetical protein